MVHRLGRMLIGETSVAVIVTAPHRNAAFEAALEGINRLKKIVPIWKKEHFVDGEVWVEGEWDENRAVPPVRRARAVARGLRRAPAAQDADDSASTSTWCASSPP